MEFIGIGVVFVVAGAIIAGMIGTINDVRKARRKTLYVGPYCRYEQTLPPAVKRRMAATLAAEPRELASRGS